MLRSSMEIIQKSIELPGISGVQVANTPINLVLHFIECHQVLDASGFGAGRIPRTSGNGKVHAKVKQPTPLLLAV